MKLKITLDNETQELQVQRTAEQLIVTRNGHETSLRIREVGDNTVVLEHHGRVIHLAGAKNGSQRQLWVDGQYANYERVQKQAGRGGTAVQGSLSATIPAVVSAILVEVGQSVEAGEKLILLESMKMIIPIQAPAAGTVTAISCAVGDSIQPGVPLVTVT
jgi:biotin carboxyl carrier protein